MTKTPERHRVESGVDVRAGAPAPPQLREATTSADLEGGAISSARWGSHGSGGPAKGVVVVLSDTQVEEVLRSASDAGSMPALLEGLGGGRAALAARLRQPENSRLSSSLLLGLLTLASFPADNSYLRLTEVAQKCTISSSAAHRYVSTLVVAGALQRDSRTRRYRLAP
jgi:hypothetical protein